jgi:hypothetical protein
MAASRCAGLIVRAWAPRTRSRAESLSAGSVDSVIITTVYPEESPVTGTATTTTD